MRHFIQIMVAGVSAIMINTTDAGAQEYPVFGNFSAGPSFPIGNFASSNFENGGFAKTGYSVVLSGGLYFNSPIGFNILSSASFSGSTDPQWGGTSKYSYNAILGGPIMGFKPIKAIKWEFRTLIGFSQSLISEDIGIYDHGNGFGYDLGTQIRYFINKLWTVNVSVDYFNAKIKYKTTDVSRDIQAINLVVGAGFNF